MACHGASAAGAGLRSVSAADAKHEYGGSEAAAQGTRMVPGERLELSRVLPRRILSPLRLPIPPPRHWVLGQSCYVFTLGAAKRPFDQLRVALTWIVEPKWDQESAQDCPRVGP